MNIAFNSKALRRLSISPTQASQEFGNEVAATFRARLADLDVARNPTELPLSFVPSTSCSIDFELPLNDGYFAIFKSNHRRDREAPPGTKLMWRQVNRIKLMEVVKRHD